MKQNWHLHMEERENLKQLVKVLTDYNNLRSYSFPVMFSVILYFLPPNKNKNNNYFLPQIIIGLFSEISPKSEQRAIFLARINMQ